MSYMKTAVSPDTSTSIIGGTMWVDCTSAKVPWDAVIPVVPTTTGTTAPVYSVSTPKGKVLTAKARLNKGSMQAYGAEHAKDVVKHRLVKDLLQQLIASGVVKITSDVSKNGAVTFTATVVVNETP